ncbi:M15 family metallopeptidase [Lacrimispora brassicae]
MKGYENDNFPRRKRRKKSKGHAIRRSIGLFLWTCICLAILISAVVFLADADPYPTVKQPDLFSISETTEQKMALPAASTDNAENGTDEAAWCLILVNKWNYIPDDYKMQLTKLANGESVDKRIYPALQEMFDAARKDHIYPIVASGYRTREKQQRLLDEKIKAYKAEGCSPKEAKTKAEAWVAIPGTSEHQLGIAVDINADGIRSTGGEVYKWLNENACKFGFIRRYPPDKTEITGVINEPWHYRYVGIKAAMEIQNQGVCLEEYLNGRK